jgi:hypothetical protein
VIIIEHDHRYGDGATIEVDGIKITTDCFRFFAKDAMVGRLFKFIKREDGVVTIESLTKFATNRPNLPVAL